MRRDRADRVPILVLFDEFILSRVGDRYGIHNRGASCADEFCLNSVRYPNRSHGVVDR
jgi:hypothetical protein